MPLLRTFFVTLLLTAATFARAQCPAAVPVAGGALPGPLPLFTPTHPWNADISAAPGRT